MYDPAHKLGSRSGGGKIGLSYWPAISYGTTMVRCFKLRPKIMIFFNLKIKDKVIFYIDKNGERYSPCLSPLDF